MNMLSGLRVAMVMATMSLFVRGAQTEDPVPEAIKPIMKAYDLGLEMEKADRPDVALSAYREAIQQAEQADDPKAKLVLTAAANNAGTILLAQGLVKEAEAMFRKAVKADPQHALAINNLAGVLLRQKKLDEAIATYEQAIKADPTQGMALNNLARLLLTAKDYPAAAKVLSASMKINPANMRDTLMLTMVVYEKMDRKQEEKDALWRVLLATTDKTPVAQLNLIKEMFKAGARQQPTRLLAEALKKNPDWPEARLLQARVQMLEGKNEAALNTIQELLPLLPNDFTVRQDAIALLTQAGKIEDAAALASQAIKVFPKLGAAWFALGCVEEKRGNMKEAEKAYYEATKLDPSLTDAWNNLGSVVSKRNDAKAAIYCFGKALDADKDNAKAKYNLARTLVISKADIKKGLQLMAIVASGTSEVAPQAKKFMDDMASIAKGGDPLKVSAK
jgi:tetratricopeptide (TPR) repeat protein